jgi:hypothetical protein
MRALVVEMSYSLVKKGDQDRGGSSCISHVAHISSVMGVILW